MNFSESTVGSGTVAWDENKDPHVWEEIGGDDGARVGPHIERVPPPTNKQLYLSTLETRSAAVAGDGRIGKELARRMDFETANRRELRRGLCRALAPI